MPLPDAFNGPGPPPDPGREDDQWSSAREGLLTGHVTSPSRDNLAADFICAARTPRVPLSKIPVRSSSKMGTSDSRTQSRQSSNSTPDSSPRSSSAPLLNVCSKIPITPRMSKSLHSTRKRKRSKIPKSTGTKNDGKKYGYMYIPTPTFVQETTISPNMESPRSTKEQFSRLPVLKRPDTSRMRMELSISDAAPVETIDDIAPIDHESVEQEKVKIEFQEIIISKEVEIRRKLRIHDEFIEAMLENRTVFDQLAFGLRELFMKVDEQDGKAISDSHCMEMVQFQSLCSQAEEIERKFVRIQQEFIGKELETPTPPGKTHAEVNAHEVKLLFEKIHEAEQSTTVDTINEAQITSLVEEFVMGSATDTYKVHGHDNYVESKPGQMISIDDIMDKYKLNEYQASYSPGIVVKSSEAAIDTFDIDKYESMRECTKHVQVLPSIAEVPDENAEYTINDDTVLAWLTDFAEPPDKDCDTSSCQSIELRSPVSVIARLDISEDLHAMRKELMSKYSSADESSPENESDMVNDYETNESNLVHAWNEYSELTDDDEVGNMLEAIKCMKKHATSGLLNVQDTIDKMLDKFVGGNDVPEDDVTEIDAVSKTDLEEVLKNDIAQTDASLESVTEIHGDYVALTVSETDRDVPDDDIAHTDADIETDPEDNVENIDSVMSEHSETSDKSNEDTDDESSPADLAGLADIMQGRETDFRTETCSITVAPSVDIDDTMLTDKSIPEILAHLNALEDERLLMMGEFAEDRKQHEKRTRKVLQFWETTARFNVHEATEILRLATCTPEDTRPESYSMNGVMEMLYNASSTDALQVIEEICQLNTEKSNAQLMMELEKGLTYHKMKLDGSDKTAIAESESEMCLYDIHQLFKTEDDSMLSDVSSHKSGDIKVHDTGSDICLIDVQQLFEAKVGAMQCDGSKTSVIAAFGTGTLSESEDDVTQSEDYTLVKGHLESDDNRSDNDKRVKSPDIMIDSLVGDSVQNNLKSGEESEIHEDLGRENEVNAEQLFALKYRDKDSRCKSAPIANIKPDVYVSKSLDAMEFKALKPPDIKELEVAAANKSGVTDTSISDNEEKIRQCDDANVEMRTEENPVVKSTDPLDDKLKSSETIVYTDNSVILNDGAIDCWVEGMASDRDRDSVVSLKKITNTVVEAQQVPAYHTTFDHQTDLEASELRTNAIIANCDTEPKQLDIIGQSVDGTRYEKKEKVIEMPAPGNPSVNVKPPDEPPLKVVYLLHNPRKSVIPLPEHKQIAEGMMTKKSTNSALVSDSNILRNDSPLQGPQAKSIFKSKDRNYERFEDHADALKPSTSREVRKPNCSRKYDTRNIKEGKNEANGDLMDLRINGTNLNEPRPIKKKNRIVRSSGAIKLITKNDLPEIKMSKKVSPEVERTKRAILDDGFSPMLQSSPARRSINSGSYSDMRRSLNPHQPLPSINQNVDQHRDFYGTPNTTTDYVATPQSDFMATPLPAIKPRRNKKY